MSTNFNTDPEVTNNYDSINLRDNTSVPKIVVDESTVKAEVSDKGFKEKTAEKINDFKNPNKINCIRP